MFCAGSGEFTSEPKLSAHKCEAPPPSYDPSYINYTVLGDGRSVWIQRKIFTHAIAIGRTDDGVGFSDFWCYQTRQQAEDAMAAWNPLTTKEPEGWIRNPRTGRRRPEGDASKEYVSD